MNEKHIAPCGMNCKLCIAYQFKEKDLPQKLLSGMYSARRKLYPYARQM